MMMAAQLALLRDPLFGSGSEEVLTFARDLEWSNRAGSFDRTERAAFIVDDGEGNLECVVWPETQSHEQAVFHGAMPPGTIAILHTHPRGVTWPSRQDEAESHRLGIAIYALTPARITKVTPSQQHAVVVDRGWLDPAPNGHPCHR